MRLFVGPSAAVATLSASTVAVVATASTGSAEYIALTVALTLMVGVIYIAGGLARMGFVARFFARPVLDGFIVGLGLYIAIGQLPKVVGIEKPSGDTLAVLVRTVTDVGNWEWSTVAVGVIGLLALFALSRFAPKLPGVIIVVVVAVLATKALDLEADGVAIVGDVPTGFQFVSLSSVSGSELDRHAPGRAGDRDRGARPVARDRQELRRQAPRKGRREPRDAGLRRREHRRRRAAGLHRHGRAVGVGDGRARRREVPPVAFLVSALMTLLTILFLAGWFADLPEAVLGAIVIWAVSGMIDPGQAHAVLARAVA